MPILNPNFDPLLKRLKLQSNELKSSLPNPFNAQKDFIGGAAELTQKRWAISQGENWSLGSQLQAGNILSSVGAPAGTDLFRGLVDVVKVDDPILEFRKWLEEKVIDIARALLKEVIERVSELAQELIGSLINAIGSIPVAGWIIEALYDVINAIVIIVKLVKAQKAEDPEAEYEAAQFNPQLDMDMANLSILGLIRSSQDWTPIFLPRGVGRNTSYGERFWSAKLTGNLGRRIGTRGTKDGWIGYIPGTSVIDQGWEIQSRGGNALFRNLGSLLPTARDMSMLCWAQVDGGSSGGKTGSPSMFTVDADGAMRIWQQFLFDLRMWLREGDTKLSEKTRRAFVDGVGRDVYGWAKWDTPFNDKKEYDNFGINQSNPVKELKRLRKRQYAFLNNIDVAYVGPGYGALKGVHADDIRNRWDKNRKKLLQHSARCLVDASNIPDVEYRLAMESAQENCVPQHIGTLTSKYEPLVPGAQEPPPPGAPIITTDLKGVRATISGETSKHRKSKNGNMLLVGLGLGLLALAAKKGK